MDESHLITSLQHPLVKHLVKLRTDANYRQESKTLMLEGLKPILEVKPFLQRVFYTPQYFEKAKSLDVPLIEITEGVLKKVSGMINPEGLIAEVKCPPFVALKETQFLLALDGISDPGNMGTLLRTALALGWNSVYFLPGCCDPFNEKSIRAARTAHFKMSFSKGNSKELKKWTETHHALALAASLEGNSPEAILQTHSLSSTRLLVLGNEAHGISQDVQSFCTPVSIPMIGQMESLNVAVAGGILLYLLSKYKSSQI